MKHQVALVGLLTIIIGAGKTWHGLTHGTGNSLPVFGPILVIIGLIVCQQSQRLKERQGLSGPEGCSLVSLLAVIWICWQVGSCRSNVPSSGYAPAAAPAAPAGKVDLAGRVVPGAKVYTKTGYYQGIVNRDVVQHGGEECVEIRMEGGEMFYLRRAAIRQGNTWFTDP